MLKSQREILEMLDNKFPKKDYEKWDYINVDSSLFEYSENVPKILISLDITKNIIKYAIENKYDLIISHHPFIFAPTKEEYFKKFPNAKILYDMLIENNISVFCLHTNFDNNSRGTGYKIIEKLGINNHQIIEKIKGNYLFKTNMSSSKKLINFFKKRIGISYVETNSSKNENINTVFLCPGSGDITEILEMWEKHKFDIVITSDLKWSEKISLINSGISYINVSHSIESVFIDEIYDILLEEKVTNSMKKYYGNVKERIA